MKRAVSDKAKAHRRDEILAAAAEAFDRLGYAAVSMSWLASRCGLAKGTLYLYFSSKESLFLALYGDELDAWFTVVDHSLDKTAVKSAAELAGLMVDTLVEQPRLAPLASILHTIIEHNIAETDALGFKRSLFDRVSATGERLEKQLDFLAAGDGARLLLRFHALAIGCWQAATPAPIARRVLEREEFVVFRTDFSEELENTLVLLLEGWRHGGGGF